MQCEITEIKSERNIGEDRVTRFLVQSYKDITMLNILGLSETFFYVYLQFNLSNAN